MRCMYVYRKKETTARAREIEAGRASLQTSSSIDQRLYSYQLLQG